MNINCHPIGSEEYWQQKVPMEEIPKWYLNLSGTTEDEIKHILSLTRQEWNNYLTVRMDPKINEKDYLYHKYTTEEPWGYTSKKSSDDSVFDLMDIATKKLDIKRLEGVNEYK